MSTETSLRALRKKIARLEAKRRLAVDQMEQEVKALADVEARQASIIKAQSILQEVAQTVQQSAHQHISRVVSRCLEAVFEEPYEFRILFERKRGRTEARLVFLRNGVEVDPLTAAGGGVVDVAGFALRLACLLLARPCSRRLVVMDEPYKFVSAGYREAIRIMLETLADELQVQFVMVTHISELRCGKVVSL